MIYSLFKYEIFKIFLVQDTSRFIYRLREDKHSRTSTLHFYFLFLLLLYIYLYLFK